MSNASLILWVNYEKNTLMSDWNTQTTIPTPVLKQGDTISVEIHQVQSIDSAGKVMVENEWDVQSNLTLAIGRVQALPTFGTYTLTFGSDETDPIAYNAPATQVQTAINAMAGISAIGGVSVSLQGTAYRVIFNTAQVLPFALNYNENDLFPTSSIGVVEARAGTTAIRAIYQVQIKQSPVASVSTFTNRPNSVASVTVIKSASYSGDTKVWRLSISPVPKDGSFNLSFLSSSDTKTTSPISPLGTSDDVANALNAIEAGWSVTKTGSYDWDISTKTASISGLAVNADGIINFSGKVGVLSLNTVEVENLLAGAESASATLEIEVETNGVRNTLIQTPVTIVNDLIDEADYTVVSRSEVMPVDSVVRYDTSQTLTSAQKQQARTNIGATGSTVDVDALEVTVGNIDTRLSTVEGNSLTVDQYGAIQWATLPTAINPFITESALTLALDDYSLTTHTHSIANVTGLQTALDGKADTAHNHTTDEVIGLEDELLTIQNSLSGKAPTSHTHTISSIEGLQEALDNNTSYVTYPDLQLALGTKADVVHEQSISSIIGLESQLTTLNTLPTRVTNVENDITNINNELLPSRVTGLEGRMETAESDISALQGQFTTIASNGSGYTQGSFDSIYYPNEITFTINGATYAIPARPI